MTRESLPQNYEPYRQEVDAIKAGRSDAVYLGNGAESSVWRVCNDDNDYVVKLAVPMAYRGRVRDTFRATEDKITAGLRGLGVQGVEQLITASPPDSAAIYQFAKGSSFEALSDIQLEQVTPQQIRDLWQTVSLASQLGIEFDGWNTGGGNIFYDNAAGFTLIDYSASSEPIAYDANRKFVLKSMGAYGVRFA